MESLRKAAIIQWQHSEVQSPLISSPVPAIVANNIPYGPNANRLQNLSIYLPQTSETLELVGTAIGKSLPHLEEKPDALWHAHIHGGAWRDPQLTSTSIEPTVAHAFSAPNSAKTSIKGIISINYTLTAFPTHPTLPYDPEKGDHDDPAREARHPDHIRDVLHAFQLLRDLGLSDDSYVLSGHSCGACLAAQAVLQPPHHWGFESIPDPPRPAALLIMNGLYDMPDLVHGLGPSHQQLDGVYATLLGNAFGTDESTWPAASPARIDPQRLTARVEEGKAPRLVVIDQSVEDQLVPVNQTEKLQAVLEQVRGVRVVRGHRCVGAHAAPWEEGGMFWEGVQDIVKMLRNG